MDEIIAQIEEARRYCLDLEIEIKTIRGRIKRMIDLNEENKELCKKIMKMLMDLEK